MNILALDPSTKSTGVAIFQDEELIYYGCITAASINKFHRIEKMKEELNKILKQYKIDKVYMEDVLPDDVNGNRDVFKALMYLQGGLCKILDDNNLAPVFIYPSEWRKQCNIKNGRGIKRESLKPKDIAFVKERYGLDVNDDIADAICIGYVAVQENTVIIEGGFEFR